MLQFQINLTTTGTFKLKTFPRSETFRWHSRVAYIKTSINTWNPVQWLADIIKSVNNKGRPFYTMSGFISGCWL